MDDVAQLAPEVLEPIRRKFGVAHCVLNIPVAKVRLQGPCVMAVVSEGKPTGMPQHMRVSLEAEARRLPARSTIRANPAVVNGAPRSQVNTNGDFGSCSRCSLRSARNSSPELGACAAIHA